MHGGKVKTKVMGKGEFEIEITTKEAFRLLCDSMDMDFFYKEDFSEFIIVEDTEEHYDSCIYKRCDDTKEGDDIITYRNKTYELYDDRGETALALYGLAKCIFMGLDALSVIPLKMLED